ncbi:MAG TPA: DinB family protein [Burkholderiales bacterium]|jgi:uncharacterized damage-inducible protein DinB|nr:DinB family protein [Burkholderiales bacterium]
MNPLRNLHMLTRYNAWANQRMFEALAKLPAGVPQKDNGGFGSMIFAMNHNYVIDRIFRGHLEGNSHGFTARNTEVMPALDALMAAQAELDAWYVAYADTLTEALHDEVVKFEFIGGGAGAMSRGDMLLHVTNHMTYHRGFVGEMINRERTKPPRMDLTVFLRDAPPRLPGDGAA